MNLKEAWRVGGPLLFALRLLRIPVGGGAEIACDSVGLQVLSLEDLSQDMQTALQPRLKEAVSLGFQVALTFTMWTAMEEASTVGCVLTKGGHESLLGLVCAKKLSKMDVYIDVNSQRTTGEEILDTTSPRMFEKPPSTIACYHKKESIREIWDIHQRRIGKSSLRPVPTSSDGLLKEIRKSHDRWIEFGVTRGFLVPAN